MSHLCVWSRSLVFICPFSPCGTLHLRLGVLRLICLPRHRNISFRWTFVPSVGISEVVLHRAGIKRRGALQTVPVFSLISPFFSDNLFFTDFRTVKLKALNSASLGNSCAIRTVASWKGMWPKQSSMDFTLKARLGVRFCQCIQNSRLLETIVCAASATVRFCL